VLDLVALSLLTLDLVALEPLMPELGAPKLLALKIGAFKHVIVQKGLFLGEGLVLMGHLSSHPLEERFKPGQPVFGFNQTQLGALSQGAA